MKSRVAIELLITSVLTLIGWPIIYILANDALNWEISWGIALLISAALFFLGLVIIKVGGDGDGGEVDW